MYTRSSLRLGIPVFFATSEPAKVATSAIPSAGTRWCKMSWHPTKIVYTTTILIHHIYMSIPALFMVTKRDFANETPKEGARRLVSPLVCHQAIGMQLFKRLSFFDGLVGFGSYSTWSTSSDTLLRPIIAWKPRIEAI